jgi:hypothetical protein
VSVMIRFPSSSLPPWTPHLRAGDALAMVGAWRAAAGPANWPRCQASWSLSGNPQLGGSAWHPVLPYVSAALSTSKAVAGSARAW